MLFQPPEPRPWQCHKCMVIYAPFIIACVCEKRRIEAHPRPNIVQLRPKEEAEKPPTTGSPTIV